MRIVLPLVAVLALVGAASSASTVPSGLYGEVTRGPVTPVCTAEQPCSAPVANAALVFSRSGREVGRTRTRQDGTYRIALAPGVYVVSAPSLRPLDPGSAWVRRGHFRKVDFSIDTGIR